MQSMMIDGRRLYHYKRQESEQEDGDAVAEYVRKRRFLMSFRPTANTMESSEQGDVHRVGYKVHVNNCHDFLEGDRIGTATEMQFVVTSVLDHQTGQLLEVTQL